MKTTIKPATASCGPPIRWIYRPLVALTVIAMSSCQLTFEPDGSKSVIIDGASLVQILADK